MRKYGTHMYFSVVADITRRAQSLADMAADPQVWVGGGVRRVGAADPWVWVGGWVRMMGAADPRMWVGGENGGGCSSGHAASPPSCSALPCLSPSLS